MTGVQSLGQSGYTELQSASRSKELGRDDFLTMFVAQLKNQDPLNPIQGQEFAAQLAQFSSLEQLFNVNETLQSLVSSQDDASRLQALGFIGKEIVARGDSLSLQEGEIASGRFELGERAECTVAVTNQNGFLVRTLYLGLLDAGSHSFQWDGHDGSGNLLSSGTYRFTVVGKTPQGALVSGDPMIAGRVTAVNLEEGNLYVGRIPVSLSDVTEITEATATGESDDG